VPQNQIRIFFDVDGVLIGGWHSMPERRKRWDVNLKQDLGIDPAALYEKLFAPSADSSPPLMHLCVAGKRDL
jgi:putative hydrolase of the HAD superfamily